MTQKTLITPNTLLAPGLKDLFPLHLHRFGNPFCDPLPFATLEDFQQFVQSLPGYYTIYRVNNSLVVDKYVINAGMFTVYHSNPTRQPQP